MFFCTLYQCKLRFICSHFTPASTHETTRDSTDVCTESTMIHEKNSLNEKIINFKEWKQIFNVFFSVFFVSCFNREGTCTYRFAKLLMQHSYLNSYSWIIIFNKLSDELHCLHHLNSGKWASFFIWIVAWKRNTNPVI